jgi:hypothetical protein
MIPIDSGNVRDFLIACVIACSVCGLIRRFHYNHEGWQRLEIHQSVDLGEKTGLRRQPVSSRGHGKAQQDALVFSRS